MNHPPFIKKIENRVSGNPVTQKAGYDTRVKKKIEKLLFYFPDPGEELSVFFEVVLFNISIRDTDLDNILKFLNKLEDEKRKNARQIFSWVWDIDNYNDNDREKIIKAGLSEDISGRDKLKGRLVRRVDMIRRYVRTGSLETCDIEKLPLMKRALKNIDAVDILKITAINPHIMKGLKKTPRPLVAWIIPAFFILPVIYAITVFIPGIPYIPVTVISIIFLAAATFIISTSWKIYPGVLYDKRICQYFERLLNREKLEPGIPGKMKELGLNVEEYHRENEYEAPDKGIKIVIKDKRTLRGAVNFLTSGDTVGSCAALENSVSWTLPSLLADESILLADIFYKGTQNQYKQRGQVWMVAGEEDGQPVLTVNSLEFNETGSRHIEILMPRIIQALQDIARRVGFKKIYVGISTYGRCYLDKHFKQASSKNTIRKIHHSKSGYKYYFDAFGKGLSFNGGKVSVEYFYQKKRGILKRLYALIFCLIERCRGNKCKAGLFYESACCCRNCWEIPMLMAG